jgi:hypothetical protein
VDEVGPSPYYYRDVEPLFGGGIRTVMGLVSRMAANDEAFKMALALDLLFVGKLGFGRGAQVFGLWPEAGYSFMGSDEHFLTAGAGPAPQSFGSWSVALVPRFLVGTAGGETGLGVRTVLRAEYALGKGGIGFEIGHQFVSHGTHRVHTLQFGVTSSWIFLGGGDG